MKLNDIKPTLKKYMNIAFRLYQDEYSFVIVFGDRNLEVEWNWNRNEDIVSVKVDTKNHCLTSEKEEVFKFALELIKTASEMELNSRKYDEAIEREYKKFTSDVFRSI